MKTYLTVYFGTVVLAMLLVPIVSRLAKWYRLVDDTGPRKVHKTPIPRIGGIVFVVSTLALVLPVFFLNNDIGESFRKSQTEFIVMIAGAVFIFAVGLFDDLRPLRGYIKLLCLIAASLAVCASGATLRSISVGTWFTLNSGFAAWPLTVLWIVMITVCMNLIDGLDGLAAGIAAIVCAAIVLMAIWSGQVAMAVLMLALLGSVTGFLFFNFYPAKIFMGDCGSMFLGFLVGAGSVVCHMRTHTLVGLAIPFLIMGIPILDTCFVVIGRRFLERRSVFAPDRNHLHHRLLQIGLHHRTVVIVIYAVTAISASISVFMLTVKDGQSIALLVVGLLLLLTMFACFNGRRYYEILKAFRHNMAIAHDVRKCRNIFEKAQLKLRESRSFREWWETVCAMGQEMHFQTIGLWNRQNGDYVSKCVWNASKEMLTTRKTAQFTLPIHANGTSEREIRARTSVDRCLEISGQQAVLLGRLIDEFPPPDQDEEPQELSLFANVTDRPMLEERAGYLTSAPALKSRLHLPAPVDIMGVPVVPFESYDQALECIEKLIASRRKSWCVAINPIKIYHSWNVTALLELLRQVDVPICDGIGVSITSKILHGRSIKRCTGCDLFFKLLFLASQKRWGVYLLGASAQSNTAAQSKLQKMYPDLRIVGWHDGYFEDSQEVIKQINISGADILFVAMGSPKQEQWIFRHRQSIDATFCMGVGGTLDVVAGNVPRAPKVFRATGTEFLFRLMREPRKRWRIQKVLFPYFIRVMRKKATDFTILNERRGDLVKK